MRSNHVKNVAGLIAVVAILAILTTVVNRQPEPSLPDSTEAIVNQHILTKAQIDEEYNWLSQRQREFTSRRTFINDYITRTLLLERFDMESIAYHPEDLLEAITRTYLVRNTTEEQMIDNLKRENLTMEDIKYHYINDYLSMMLLNISIFDLRSEAEQYQQEIDQLQAALRLEADISINRRTDSRFPSYEPTGEQPCTEDGKPLVILYTSSACSHCKWIRPIFQEVIQDYDIQPYILDESATHHLTFLQKYNPSNLVPFTVIGCRYIRTGNAYEPNTGKEERELRAAIQAVLGS